jgi:adenosylcobyric acid synthase
MKKNPPLQIMFLGTASDVGKSVIAAAFCRILFRKGYSVSPFKAQNMALNSFVTMDGKEMGRAQVFQAYAAGVLPDADMNPVLLKPASKTRTQVIVQGKVQNSSTAQEYYSMHERVVPAIMESFHRLRERFDAIVLEGAGSLTELNLKKKDVVNLPMALAAGSPVVIVADIDRGGVFASCVGTMKLLSRREKKLVIGFIINKFQGDKTLFADGVKIIEKLTRKPVLGVVPFFRDIHLQEEDSVALHMGKKGKKTRTATVRIGVVNLPYISNYTDFDPLEAEDDVSLHYTQNPDELEEMSVVIIPGTKNTVEDLLWLIDRDFEQALERHVHSGKTLVGICGGFQMLGNTIEDPLGIETDKPKVKALGYLDVSTVLQPNKTLSQVKAHCLLKRMKTARGTSVEVEGYEIHMGKSTLGSGASPAFAVKPEAENETEYGDGAFSASFPVWGTYIHGLFENDDFRAAFLHMHGGKHIEKFCYREYLNEQFDRLADLVSANVEVDRIITRAQEFRQQTAPGFVK